MPKRHSTAKQRVEFGLRTIPKDKKVSVSLRDLMFVHQVLAEYMQFFHQPMHYPAKKDVDQFLGNRFSGGAFEVLHTALYRKMRGMLPKEIHDAFGEGVRFEHPLPPDYYEEKG
jgi:hypothetical protein